MTFYADEGISFLDLRFENDVKMYGTQAIILLYLKQETFENDVKMYGTQAVFLIYSFNRRLRMM